MSYLSLGEADKAEADLVTAARLEPANRAVQVSLLSSSSLLFFILHCYRSSWGWSGGGGGTETRIWPTNWAKCSAEQKNIVVCAKNI